MREGGQGDSREGLVCSQVSRTSGHTGPLLRRQVPRILKTWLTLSSSPHPQCHSLVMPVSQLWGHRESSNQDPG